MAGIEVALFQGFCELSASRQWIQGSPQPLAYSDRVAWMDENGYRGTERRLCLEVFGSADHAWLVAWRQAQELKAK
jgi:hypothetical protein